MSKQIERFLDKAVAISLDPMQAEAAFMARQLVQATLPHSDPGDIPAWIRRNGNLTLAVQSGIDLSTGKNIGIPYGSIPRLLLFWMTTEALRTGSRKLYLGENLSDFMRQLDLVPTGGRWGSITRLRKQMERLLQARISFDYSDEHRKRWLNMEIAPQGELWWDYKNPDNGSLFENWLELGEHFYKAITESPVPLDMRALKALKQSPLALDMYAWATYTTYQANKTSKARSVSWELLHKQFGGDYAEVKAFKRYALKALRKVQIVYPAFKMEQVRGGVEVVPSSTAITMRPAKRQKTNI
jgi:hypothetical protein